MDKQEFISSLEHEWKTGAAGRAHPTVHGGRRAPLGASIAIEYSLARCGAARLWQLSQDDAYVAVLSARTGQSRQFSRAGGA